MIRFPLDLARQPAAVRFGLEVLVDLARLLPAEGTIPAVQLLVDPGAGGSDLERARFDVGAGEVRIPALLLLQVVERAGAAIEQRSPARDRHGRVPSSENPLVAAGLERRPEVSLAAIALREAVVRAAGARPVRCVAPWPAGHRWAVAITHDLDVVDWWPAFTVLRLAELARRGQLGRLLRVLGRATLSIAGDPVWAGLADLLGLERELGVPSTWFVLCGAPSIQSALAGDLTYGPGSRRLRRILEAVGREHHHIGLHGSFATMESAERFRAERTQLSRLAGGEAGGVRQHYLRMRPGATQGQMRAAGFRYDASYGFPDRNGFRLGVADVVPGWDEPGQRESGLAEVPLVWMDRALSKYAGEEDPEAWIADGVELARTCARCEGLWVGLWHPNLVPALGFPGAPAALRTLLETLLRDRPLLGTLDDLVQWRVARRSIRAVGQAADGTLHLDGQAADYPEIVLEDAEGRVVQRASWPRH